MFHMDKDTWNCLHGRSDTAGRVSDTAGEDLTQDQGQHHLLASLHNRQATMAAELTVVWSWRGQRTGAHLFSTL